MLVTVDQPADDVHGVVVDGIERHRALCAQVDGTALVLVTAPEPIPAALPEAGLP
jgi:hypothetical protein